MSHPQGRKLPETDGGERTDTPPIDRITDVLQELAEEGELSTERAEELLQLGVLEFSKMVLTSSSLTRDDVGERLRMIADGIDPAETNDTQTDV